MYEYVEKMQTRQDTAKCEKTRLKNNLCQCRNYDEANLDDSIAAIEQSTYVCRTPYSFFSYLFKQTNT